MQLPTHPVSAMPNLSAFADVSFDAPSINIKESSEIDYWVQTLGVSEEQLRIAVAAVGVQVEDLRNHLGMLRPAG